MTSNGPNLALNASTLAALLIALVVGGFVAADLYNTVQQIKQQSESNGMAVNQTISQILEGQEQGNKRGNITIAYFDKIFQRQLENEQLKAAQAHLIEKEKLERELEVARGIQQ